MNLKEIRDEIFARVDWAPSASTEAKARVDGFINAAYNRICLESPFLFFESRVKFATQADSVPTDLSDTISLIEDDTAAVEPNESNPWVFEQSAGSNLLPWQIDRTWDGRVIDITDANGVVHRNRIRTVWQEEPRPAVAATATITVATNLLGVAFTAPGDEIRIAGIPLTCVAGAAGPDEFEDSTQASFVSRGIQGAPYFPAGGINNPGSFTTICSAASGVLTSVPIGSLGNGITLSFVPLVPSLPPAIAVTPFSGGIDAIPGKYRLSVMTPWSRDKFGTGPFKYRIYTEEYFLPDDVVTVNSMRLWREDRNWPLSVVGQLEAEDLSLAAPRNGVASGLPRTIFRRGHRKIEGPSVPPAVTLAPPQSDVWLGPEPAGTFEYIITYTWGKRDIQFCNPTMGYEFGYDLSWDNIGAFGSSPVSPEDASSNRFREPLWESAPSPVSAKITAKNALDQGAGAPAIQLLLPNIEYMQGFLGVGSAFGGTWSRVNARQSGWHVRIYRRRHTEDYDLYTLLDTIAPSGAEITGLRKLDIKTAFFLLAEVRIDELNEGVFVDNGRVLPDYHRRLRDVHGYQSVQLYPQPDDRYEVDVRCIRRPEKLVDDQDVPVVHAEAVDLVTQRALVYLYESMGNPEGAQLAQMRYDRQLFTLAKRYGDLREAGRPTLRRFSRARRSGTERGGLRQWWTTKV